MNNWRKKIVAVLLGVVLLTASCVKEPPSRFDQAQQNSSSRGSSAVVKESETGGSFNRYFPSAGSGYQRVYTQEKKGFAQAKLKKDGKSVATMAISDTANNPTARSKFQNSQGNIGGYPTINQGSKSTAILVGDRFQVKISSSDTAFTESDRKQWLGKFDLRGLSRLN